MLWVTPDATLTPSLRAAITANQTTLAVFVPSASAAPAADAPRSGPPQAATPATTPAAKPDPLAEFEAQKQTLIADHAQRNAGTLTEAEFFGELEKLRPSA